MPRRFLHRHQPPGAASRWIKAGLGATAAFASIWALGDAAGVPMIVAPLGASAVLVMGMPESPLSQPANVIGGHAVAATLALLADHLAPSGPVTLAATVGFVIALLGLIRLTHPPAGATSLVVMLTHPDWPFLFTPVIAGSLAMVLIAILVHHLPPRLTYPLPIPRAPEPEPPDDDGGGGKVVFGQVIVVPPAESVGAEAGG